MQDIARLKVIQRALDSESTRFIWQILLDRAEETGDLGWIEAQRSPAVDATDGDLETGDLGSTEARSPAVGAADGDLGPLPYWWCLHRISLHEQEAPLGAVGSTHVKFNLALQWQRD